MLVNCVHCKLNFRRSKTCLEVHIFERPSHACKRQLSKLLVRSTEHVFAKVFASVGVWTPTCKKSALVRAPILFQLPQVTARIIILQFIDIAENKVLDQIIPKMFDFLLKTKTLIRRGFASRTSSACKNSWGGYGWVISASFFIRNIG